MTKLMMIIQCGRNDLAGCVRQSTTFQHPINHKVRYSFIHIDPPRIKYRYFHYDLLGHLRAIGDRIMSIVIFKRGKN